MSKISVDFHIQNESQTQSFKTQGTLKDNQMIFHDEKDQKHILTIHDQRLEYERKGDPAFVFTFEEHVLHKGTYQLGQQSMSLDIQTHELTMNANKIIIDYTLKQDDVVVGHSTINIHYHLLKEGSA